MNPAGVQFERSQSLVLVAQVAIYLEMLFRFDFVGWLFIEIKNLIRFTHQVGQLCASESQVERQK